jgi:hypothetical protein
MSMYKMKLLFEQETSKMKVYIYTLKNNDCRILQINICVCVCVCVCKFIFKTILGDDMSLSLLYMCSDEQRRKIERRWKIKFIFKALSGILQYHLNSIDIPHH